MEIAGDNPFCVPEPTFPAVSVAVILRGFGVPECISHRPIRLNNRGRVSTVIYIGVNSPGFGGNKIYSVCEALMLRN